MEDVQNDTINTENVEETSIEPSIGNVTTNNDAKTDEDYSADEKIRDILGKGNVLERIANGEVSEENMKEALSLADKYLRHIRDLVQIMEKQWSQTRGEFKVTTTQVDELCKYNQSHATPKQKWLEENPPIDGEEPKKFDILNGLDGITAEEVIQIFGKEHDIIGVTHDVTKDRLRMLLGDFIEWISALSEYRNMERDYVAIISEREELEIERMRDMYEKEEDPEKKAKMKQSLDEYENVRELKFLAECTDDQIRRCCDQSILSNMSKMRYRVRRTRDRLGQFKLPESFILELSNFEGRMLDEKYHGNKNSLLMYFMNEIVYNDINDAFHRCRMASFVITIDQFARKVLPDIRGRLTRITDNINTFEERVLEYRIKEAAKNTEIEQ